MVLEMAALRSSPNTERSTFNVQLVNSNTPLFQLFLTDNPPDK